MFVRARYTLTLFKKSSCVGFCVREWFPRASSVHDVGAGALGGESVPLEPELTVVVG